jgi:hypothetical protein
LVGTNKPARRQEARAGDYVLAQMTVSHPGARA